MLVLVVKDAWSFTCMPWEALQSAVLHAMHHYGMMVFVTCMFRCSLQWCLASMATMGLPDHDVDRSAAHQHASCIERIMHIRYGTVVALLV
jgi:hypothetical protein